MYCLIFTLKRWAVIKKITESDIIKGFLLPHMEFEALFSNKQGVWNKKWIDSVYFWGITEFSLELNIILSSVGKTNDRKWRAVRYN